MVSTTLIGLFYLLGYLDNHAFCCSEVEYIKYNYMHIMVLSKVVAAESLQSDGIWSRLNPRNHYTRIAVFPALLRGSSPT
jgi:hypothetical protein